ncbi:hypothetical protein EFM39_00005, partial [Streptococcus thermophilus]|nr:hypothetical protein [Streptococcus thermophilus]
VIGINLFLVMFCNSTITDLFLFVFTQLILHYQIKNKHGSHSNTQNKTFRCAKGERNHIAYLTRKI